MVGKKKLIFWGWDKNTHLEWPLRSGCHWPLDRSHHHHVPQKQFCKGHAHSHKNILACIILSTEPLISSLLQTQRDLTHKAQECLDFKQVPNFPIDLVPWRIQPRNLPGIICELTHFYSCFSIILYTDLNSQV